MRIRDLLQLGRALEERLTRALDAAHGHGVARGRAVGELLLELRPAARVLGAVLHAGRPGAIELGHGRHALALDALGEGLAILLEPGLLSRVAAAAAAAGRDGERQRLAGMADGELEAGRGAHRQADQVRLGKAQRRHHRSGVVGRARLRIGRDVVRHVRRRPAPRGVGDAAVAAREVADLRFPAQVMAAELVEEQDRIALARLLVIELNPVVGFDVRHRPFPPRPLPA